MAAGKCCLLKPQQVSRETKVVLRGLGNVRCCMFKFSVVTIHLVYLSGTYKLEMLIVFPWCNEPEMNQCMRVLCLCLVRGMIKDRNPFSALSLPFYLEASRGMLTAHHHVTTSLLDESNF